MEFSFSVIVVSETWAPKGKSEVKERELESYQNYHGNRRSSIKSGCDFYVKILILLIMIQIMNSNLLVFVFTTGTQKNSNNMFLENLKLTLHT